MLSQRGVGTAVFGGMLAAAIVGIFFVPALYAIFQSMRERLKGVDGKASAPTSVSPASQHLNAPTN
jgi:hypothetical protein